MARFIKAGELNYTNGRGFSDVKGYLDSGKDFDTFLAMIYKIVETSKSRRCKDDDDLKDFLTGKRIPKALADFITKKTKGNISFYHSKYDYVESSDITHFEDYVDGDDGKINEKNETYTVRMEVFDESQYTDHDVYIYVDGKKYLMVNWGEDDLSFLLEDSIDDWVTVVYKFEIEEDEFPPQYHIFNPYVSAP